MSKKLKLPELAGIHKFDKVKYDPKFTNPKNPPKWYRLNHSGNPNAIMKSGSKFVYWVPLRDIKKRKHRIRIPQLLIKDLLQGTLTSLLKNIYLLCSLFRKIKIY